VRGDALPYPTIYDVSYSYTGFQQAQGNNSFPGTQLDADLAGLDSSIVKVASFVRGVMRSDGALNNGVVTLDSLDPFVSTYMGRGALGPPGPATPFDFESRLLASGATINALQMYLRTAGFYAAGDGGDTLYKRGTVGGPGAFQSADGAYWQIANVSSAAPVWDARAKYNLDNTGVADNAAALLALRNDLAAIELSSWQTGTQPTMPMVVFDPGIYRFTSWPNFALNNLNMVGLGHCQLWYAANPGTNVWGTAVTFDGTVATGVTDPANGKFNMRFEGFEIVPVSTALDGLVLEAIHHSYFRVRVLGAGAPRSGVRNSCVKLKFCVCTHFDDLSITAFDIAMSNVVVPGGVGSLDAYGVFIDQGGIPSGQMTGNCTFARPIIEGLYDGVVLNFTSSGGCHFYNGTIEACANRGIWIQAGCSSNVFSRIDMEGNGTNAVCDSGSHDNQFLYTSGSVLNLVDGGTNNFVSSFGSDTNQPVTSSVTPSAALATLDASSQAGITVANGANAVFTPGGQGILALVVNGSSSSAQLAIVGGGGVQSVLAAANWTMNTTTPSAGNQSLSYDGVGAYRIYNNTGASVVYKALVLKTM
jgi:hypothetical protein